MIDKAVNSDQETVISKTEQFPSHTSARSATGGTLSGSLSGAEALSKCPKVRKVNFK